MSLDGFVAGPQGERDWIEIDPDFDFKDLFSAFDTLLVGRKTYEKMRDSAGPSSGMKTIVFSRCLDPSDCPGAVLSDNALETISDLRLAPGKDFLVFGGGGLFASLLDLKLIDSIEIQIVPRLLGNGIRFLPERGIGERLILTDTRLYPKTGVMWLSYDVQR